jgi:hypothetical protein
MPAHHVHVRDVVRKHEVDLPASEVALRVPYDLFNPTGPVLLKGDLINYLQSGVLRTGRAVSAQLGDTRPGERVLVRLPPLHAENEWWLCEVTAVDDIAVA